MLFRSEEGEDAVWLENRIRDAGDEPGNGYAFPVAETEDGTLEMDWHPMLTELVRDLKAGLELSMVSARFHLALARAVLDAALHFPGEPVVLSGGCFQNLYLLEKTAHLLESAGIRVYTNVQVPANDGGISLGQAAVALAKWEETENVSGDSGNCGNHF